MNPRRFTTMAPAFCGTVVLAGGIVAWLAGIGSAGIKNTGAVPIEDRAASLAANAKLADEPQAIPMGNAAVANAAVASAEVATAAEPVTGTATDTTAASDKPESIVVAALPDPSQMLPADLPPVQVATANPSDLVPNGVKDAVSRIEILDECLVAETCIDRFLWALYQRTPKEDTIKVHERRKVTVKKKGKTVTVTKTFTRLVDEDFTWKDPKAAEKAGMPMMDYVIGGMERSFKLKLFHTLHAAEQAGLSPGITSAFRDDYRQSIASGLKAATDRSYHGGSFRGGYGRGLAADVVSVKGGTRAQRWISTESLWKWIDARGKEFGIGRPYLDRDPPHLAPIDSKEYAARRGPKAQHAESQVKKRTRLAARDDHSVRRTNSAHRRKADMRVVAQVRR
jgi:phage-related protein